MEVWSLDKKFLHIFTNIFFPNMKKLYKNKGGSGYIEAAIFVIIVVLSLALTVSVFCTIHNKFVIDSAASEIASQVAQDGKYDDAEIQWVQNYLSRNNISNTTVTCTTSGNIPQDTEFTITLVLKTKMGVGGDMTLIDLTGKGVGRGSVYWK